MKVLHVAAEVFPLVKTGGLADVDMAYDGKVLSVLGKKLNVFASAEMQGSIDDLIKKAEEISRDEYDKKEI